MAKPQGDAANGPGVQRDAMVKIATEPGSGKPEPAPQGPILLDGMRQLQQMAQSMRAGVAEDLLAGEAALVLFEWIDVVAAYMSGAHELRTEVEGFIKREVGVRGMAGGDGKRGKDGKRYQVSRVLRYGQELPEAAREEQLPALLHVLQQLAQPGSAALTAPAEERAAWFREACKIQRTEAGTWSTGAWSLINEWIAHYGLETSEPPLEEKRSGKHHQLQDAVDRGEKAWGSDP
jgi:hypothetical protein